MANRTETFDVLGVRVSALNLEKAARVVAEMIDRRERGYVCVAPVSTVVDSRRSEEYRAIINGADLVTPDGMPLVWLGQWKGHKDVRRTYGPDLMLKLCDVGQAQGWRHFFYGGTKDVCDRLSARLQSKFPALNVVGKIAPPYMPKAVPAPGDVIDAINAARPDILWVGLGSPKQDHWIVLNRQALQVPVIIGIGAAFDFHSGIKPQAPLWMQRSGSEWLFRLGCEPGRLWRRYLVGNSLFVWWLLCDLFSGRSKS